MLFIIYNKMDKNSLSKLVGQYMSDSENEEDVQGNMSQEINSLLDEINQKNGKDNVPTTYWTECIDLHTGLPYYWNTETKEVTWEKPEEYSKYLEFMKSYEPQSADKCWNVGYSEDTKNKYYVNQYTRVVSWKKPPGFIETAEKAPRETKSSTNKGYMKTKPAKKKYPNNLECDSDNEKIELISSYEALDKSSSEEETGDTEAKLKNFATNTKSANKLKLVAAYATDSESDREQDHDSEENNILRTPSKDRNMNKEEIKTYHTASERQGSISPIIKTEPKDFASIITGGKPEGVLDEELENLKQELKMEISAVKVEDVSHEVSPQELSFDEKTFQRKRRIEFKSNPIVKQTTRNENRTGLGFHKTESSEMSSDKKKFFINFQKSHVEFEKTISQENETLMKSNETNETTNKMQVASYRKDIEEMCVTIEGKVKFLLVDKPEISAIHIVNIQLETLLKAFRLEALNEQYFFKWLKETTDDLTTLEKNAAPEGWECSWDRQNSQYSYKNLKTGDIQWNFPGDELAETTTDDLERPKYEHQRGEDEMDISTTPPPNEHEEIKIENKISDIRMWELENSLLPVIITAKSTRSRDVKSGDINSELASFYNDLACIETKETPGNVAEPEGTEPSELDKNSGKRQHDDSSAKKRKKKIRVQGLGSKMKEVSNMVANWQKAQKELDN